jgi:hypothetical protein
MNCSLHPNVASITNCANCQTPLCSECAVADGEDRYLCSRCIAFSAVSDYKQASEQKQKDAVQHDEDEERNKKLSAKAQVVIIAVCMLIIVSQFTSIFSDDMFITEFQEPTTMTETDHSNRCMAFLIAAEILIEPEESIGKDNVAKYCKEPPFNITQTYNEISIKSPDSQAYGFSEVRIDREKHYSDFID